MKIILIFLCAQFVQKGNESFFMHKLFKNIKFFCPQNQRTFQLYKLHGFFCICFLDKFFVCSKIKLKIICANFLYIFSVLKFLEKMFRKICICFLDKFFVCSKIKLIIICANFLYIFSVQKFLDNLFRQSCIFFLHKFFFCPETYFVSAWNSI